MKSLFFLFAITLIIFGGCNANDKKENEVSEETVEQEDSKKTGVQYGKIQHVELTNEVDKKMAEQGQRVFDVSCTSCHKYDERYVGPALRDVAKRRTPEYIMNMILDTETMIENDDTVKCLLQTYLLKMPNMQVDEKDARSVLEHLREITH